MAETAKIFISGRSQAVRLPKEFRFEGTEVRISKVGGKVILEPMEKKPFEIEALWNKLDSYKDIPFPDLPEDAPVLPDDLESFDFVPGDFPR